MDNQSRDFSRERAVTGDQFIKDRSEAKYVGALVDGLTASLLRRHVPYRTQHGTGLSQRGHLLSTLFLLPLHLHPLCQPEVKNFDASCPRQHDIFRLEVAVHYADFVSRGETLGNLGSNRYRFGAGDRAPADHGPQRLAVNELRNDEKGLVLATNIEDRNDIWVI